MLKNKCLQLCLQSRDIYLRKKITIIIIIAKQT